MTELDFQQLLQRYLQGQCSAKERSLVEQWYDQLEQASAEALPPQDQAAIEKAIWARMARVTAPAAPRVVPLPAPRWHSPRLRWAALALLAAGLGLFPFLKPGPNPQPSLAVHSAAGWRLERNATQQPQAMQLPDGSRVTLNPGSELRYAAAFAGPRREVYLTGEAFFQVRKNPARPFLVLTQQVVTTVLGTSFWVKASAGSPSALVSVREGKVAVQARQGAQLEATPAHPAVAGLLLLPNQQAVYSATTQQLKKELVDCPVVLVPQAFEFEERPVADVFAALEKAYGVEIVYDQAKLASCTVSITFYDEPLFDKLSLLCKSLGASYSLSGEQIIVQSAGCQSPPGS